MTGHERAAWLEELRRRWRSGTLDEVLVPESPDLGPLLRGLRARPERRDGEPEPGEGAGST